jgi:hypothetical protein
MDPASTPRSPLERIGLVIGGVGLLGLLVGMPVAAWVGYLTGHGNRWGHWACVAVAGVWVLFLAVTVTERRRTSSGPNDAGARAGNDDQR